MNLTYIFEIVVLFEKIHDMKWDSVQRGMTDF